MARSKPAVEEEAEGDRGGTPDGPRARTPEEIAVFEAMFRAHYREVCGFARRFVKSPAVAEELAQEVFGRIWARPGVVDAGRNVRGYLFTAAKRTALNYLVREGLGARYEVEMQEAAMVPAAAASLSDAVEEQELEARVRAAVEALPPQTRAVWRLQREAGMSYAQVARELGISIKTVEKHMGRALHLLRTRLGGYLVLVVAAVLSR